MVDAVPGWYDDPENPGQLRWWNGVSWTEHRAAAPTLTPASASTSLAPAATPATTSRPGSKLLAITLVSILVAGFVFATIAVINESASQARAIPVPAPSVTPSLPGAPVPAPTMPTVTMPGMPGEFQLVSRGGNENFEISEWTSESAQFRKQHMDARCAPLAFDAPIGGGSRDSWDPTLTLPNYLSHSGGTTLSGGMAQFPTQTGALNYTTHLRALLTSCRGGFADGNGTDTVTIDAANYPTVSTLAWTQVITTSTQSYTVHSIDMRKGSTIAREYCYQLSGTTDSPELCGQWSQEVVAVMNGLHN
jgi:hypothetical protein